MSCRVGTVKLAVLGEALDGFNVLAAAAGGQGQARADKPAIDDDAASAANADAAAFFCTREAEVIPQSLQQQPVRLQLQLVLFTVDE